MRKASLTVGDVTILAVVNETSGKVENVLPISAYDPNVDLQIVMTPEAFHELYEITTSMSQAMRFRRIANELMKAMVKVLK
jgi:hypothetical protein